MIYIKEANKNCNKCPVFINLLVSPPQPTYLLIVNIAEICSKTSMLKSHSMEKEDVSCKRKIKINNNFNERSLCMCVYIYIYIYNG